MADQMPMGGADNSNYAGGFGNAALGMQNGFDFRDDMADLDESMALPSGGMNFSLPDDMGDTSMIDTNPGQSFFDPSQVPFQMGPTAFNPPQGMPDFGMAGWPAQDFQQSNNLGDMAGFGQPAPPSGQADIVSGQTDSAAQKFGQVTPPDDQEPVLAKSGQAQPPSAEAQAREKDDAARLSREQRARNAANKRHAKAKPGRKSSKVDDDQNVRIKDYREKNRVAAAKCRAKKKGNTETLEAEHREASATNNHLKRQMRELRNELTSLRSCSLEHRPGTCNCEHIHEYNLRQAQQIARGVGPYNVRAASVASAELSPSTASPGSDSASVGAVTGPTGMAASEQQRPAASRLQSMAAPLSLESSPAMNADAMSMPGSATDMQGSQAFGDFFQGSSGSTRDAFS